MAELVTIRPKKNSKKFTAIRGQMTQFQKLTSEGDEVQDAGEYKSERFPRSRQIFRPIWSESKRRWLLKGFEKMDGNKQGELNELVEGCRFQYSDKHPNQRQFIKTADVHDMRDPFFTHPKLRILMKEGELSMDKERAFDKLMLAALSMDNSFQRGGEQINSMLSARVRYVITDKNVDTKIKKDIREKKKQAIMLESKLTDDKKLKIAMAMGLISNALVDRSLIDEVIWKAVEDDKTRVAGTKMTKQDFFIKMCETTSEELNTRHLIQKAKASGNLKKNKAQGYLLFGQPVGRTENQLFEYFNNPENQEMLLRLEQALENDKSD